MSTVVVVKLAPLKIKTSIIFYYILSYYSKFKGNKAIELSNKLMFNDQCLIQCFLYNEYRLNQDK